MFVFKHILGVILLHLQGPDIAASSAKNTAQSSWLLFTLTCQFITLSALFLERRRLDSHLFILCLVFDVILSQAEKHNIAA